jgi:hypothetical protein
MFCNAYCVVVFTRSFLYLHTAIIDLCAIICLFFLGALLLHSCKYLLLFHHLAHHLSGVGLSVCNMLVCTLLVHHLHFILCTSVYHIECSRAIVRVHMYFIPMYPLFVNSDICSIFVCVSSYLLLTNVAVGNFNLGDLGSRPHWRSLLLRVQVRCLQFTASATLSLAYLVLVWASSRTCGKCFC